MTTTEAPLDAVRPPRSTGGTWGWLRRNLFNSPLNSAVSVLLLALIPLGLVQLLGWVFGEATWAPVVANVRLFMVGRYPADQAWRVQSVVGVLLVLLGLSAGVWRGLIRQIATTVLAAVVLLALLPFALPTRLWLAGTALGAGLGYAFGLRAPRLRRPLLVLWLVSPLVIWTLVRGLGLALPRVDPLLWGGLLLTLMLAALGITLSFPLGVLLALGRRSGLPAVRAFSIGYIELIRGVPLVTLLFMAALMLPYFLPAGSNPSQFVRAAVAITLFSAAYLAETVRGGLQAVPRGQEEAAKALGLNVFHTTGLIVLPQALRAVIPAIVGQFISLFKDTSLVAIVSLQDLLGIAVIVYNQPEWLTVPGRVEREVLLFVAAIYWIFCFGMSRVSRAIEARLGVGTR